MTRQIPLTRGYVALVDDDDFARVMAAGKWHVSVCAGSLYARHDAGRKSSFRLHTFLTGLLYVDHVNGDGLDNRQANLRAATASQNGANISAPIHNTSGYKGVSLYTRTGRWRATITVDQIARHLGYFDSALEAARAYDGAAIQQWGDFARPNFPQERSA